MTLVPIARPTGKNIAGACHLDVVAVSDVAVMPAAIACNVIEPVVLGEGKVWSRIQLATPGSRLLEKWSVQKGAPISDCTISGSIGKDQLALLPTLWSLPTARFLVLFSGMDGTTLLVGTVAEGCQIAVTDRDRGDERNPANGYTISFRLRRAVPVPFYQATPPPPDPACPTLAELLALLPAPDVIAAMPPDLVAAITAALIAALDPEDLLPLLSLEQITYIAQQQVDGVDGGDAGPGGGGGDGGTVDFDSDDFDSNDFD